MKKLFAVVMLAGILILGGFSQSRADDARDVKAKAQEIVAQVVQPGMSDYDKALALYD